MQSPQLPLLAEESNIISNAPEENQNPATGGPIPANELARTSRLRERQQNRLKAILKLVLLICAIILMILIISFLILGAISQIQKRTQVILIMLKRGEGGSNSSDSSDGSELWQRPVLPKGDKVSEEDSALATKTIKLPVARTSMAVPAPKKLAPQRVS